MQVADARTVLGNFDNARLEGTTFHLRDGKFFVNTEGPDGKRADFAIKYTVGMAAAAVPDAGCRASRNIRRARSRAASTSNG